MSHKELLVLLLCFVNDLTLLATHQLETRIESKLSQLSPRTLFLLIHGGLYLSRVDLSGLALCPIKIPFFVSMT